MKNKKQNIIFSIACIFLLILFLNLYFIVKESYPIGYFIVISSVSLIGLFVTTLLLLIKK